MAIIRRPDPKFQLGFSVEDGIVCLRSQFVTVVKLVPSVFHGYTNSILVACTLYLGFVVEDVVFLLFICMNNLKQNPGLLFCKVFCFLQFTVDLQSNAGGYCRKRRNSCRTPHH